MPANFKSASIPGVKNLQPSRVTMSHVSGVMSLVTAVWLSRVSVGKHFQDPGSYFSSAVPDRVTRPTKVSYQDTFWAKQVSGQSVSQNFLVQQYIARSTNLANHTSWKIQLHTHTISIHPDSSFFDVFILDWCASSWLQWNYQQERKQFSAAEPAWLLNYSSVTFKLNHSCMISTKHKNFSVNGDDSKW